MTSREIKARYKHAVLGFLWVLLNPILQMLILGFVFRFFVPVEVDNYFLFLFTGLLPWMFFSLSVTKATPSIVHERGLIQKAKFPREVIVLAIVLSNLFHFLISLGLLVVLLIGDKILFEAYTASQVISYSFRMIGIFPLAIWLTMLTSGLSLLTAALNVKFRDVNFVVQAFMPLWFYATPIVYTLKLLPERLYPLFYVNPMTAIIEGFHQVLLFQKPAEPELGLISFIISLIILYSGIWVFSQEKKWFDDWF
jgi:ABC-2 type transport system permease protein